MKYRSRVFEKSNCLPAAAGWAHPKGCGCRPWRNPPLAIRTGPALAVVIAFLLAASCIFAVADEGFSRTSFPNGLTLLVKPNHFSDLVAVEVMLKVSITDESREETGVRSLLQGLLMRGSGAKADIGKLEEWGGAVGADVGLDYVEFGALVVGDCFETAVQTLADLLQKPDFDPAAIERLKQEKLPLMEALQEDPFQGTYLLFRQELYGEYPYAGANEGSRETITALSAEKLKAFYSRWYLPNNAVIAVCGNVTPEQAQQVVEKAFKDWKPQPLPERTQPKQSPLTHSLLAVREGKIANSYLLVGFPAPPAGKSEEFAAFQVLNSLLGRGMSGRLIEVLRNDLGLAYEVSCFYPVLKGPSHLGIYVICSPDDVEEVKEAVIGQINRILQEEISKEELEAAKRYLLGQYLLSLQSSRQQAYDLAWYEILGLGAGFREEYPVLIGSIRPENVRRVSQSYLGKMVIAVRLPE